MTSLGRECFDYETVATQQKPSLNLVVREIFFLVDSCVYISVDFFVIHPVQRHSDFIIINF